MSQPESRNPVHEASASTSDHNDLADAVETKSLHTASDAEEGDLKLNSLVAPIAAVPHLTNHDDEDVWIADAQAGAVGATWKHRLPALLMVLFLTLGSNFAQSSLGPLKSTIKKEIKSVTNARYGAISSADQLINGVLPLFSGIMIDYYGPSITSVLSSSAVLIGVIVRAVGGQRRSFATILAGQIIFGFGSTTIETSQSKLYTHWCRDSTSLSAAPKQGQDGEDKVRKRKWNRGAALSSAGWLGFVYGLDIAMGRVFNIMGSMSSVPVAESTGKWYWSFWLSAILCAVTLGLNLAYVVYERALPQQMRVVTGRQLAAQAALASSSSSSSDEKHGQKRILRPFSLRHWQLLTLSVGAIPAAFWLVTMTQVLQSGTVGAYTSNLAEVVQITWGKSKLRAGYASSVGQIPPIVLTPLLGLMFDLFGRRMYYVSGCAALWVVVFALLAFSRVNVYLPVVLGSVALSFNALPFIASIPLLVPNQASIGTAFGIWKCFNSAGSVTMDVAFGAIQDLTPRGTSQFRNAFSLLIALKSVDVVYGLLYHVIDRRYFGGVLRLNERELRDKAQTETDAERTHALRKPIRNWTLAGCSLLVAFVTTGYVLYIVYSIGT
ncbi:hypothetical protein EX895_006369 [Sporisorium graminicola]|uniref:Lysosomal dipeptide transporter MFSD1 n=1 Tax=Sporisorium graminicola TaxID=280036 RepID=A0A4V6ETH7_9BASI|nr:hypothetical protein EX895_006369 [Sporisorium graminicola]TKY85289.1 hypothetical protein EX895_006369 [Sporisorium graminicola]